MPFVASDTGTGDGFAITPAGKYLARCYRVIDLGFQEASFNNKITVSPQMWLEFELHETAISPDQRIQITGNTYTVGKFYMRSTNERANLRKHLEAWRGRPFTETEIAGFDVATVLGHWCEITIVHRPNKNGELRAYIDTISVYPKGMAKPQPVHQDQSYDTELHNAVVFDALPPFIRTAIENRVVNNEQFATAPPAAAQAPPQQAAQAASAQAPAAAPLSGDRPAAAPATVSAGDDFFDDDIPF